ncbi:MAG: DUF2975 domain-containing protein [Bacillota bacterium]|nr:DUF2975 domain-containing protein [Bacillota bacterium]
MKYIGKKSLSSVLQILLNIMWYVLLAIVVIIPVFMVITLLVDPNLLSKVGQMKLKIYSSGFDVYLKTAISTNDMKTFVAITLSLAEMITGIALIIVYQLRMIFKTLVKETPFTQENAKRIRLIGIVLIFGTVFAAILDLIMGNFYMQHVKIPDADITTKFSIDFGSVLIACVIIILSEVFRRGAKLQEEHDLTV